MGGILSLKKKKKHHIKQEIVDQARERNKSGDTVTPLHVWWQNGVKDRFPLLIFFGLVTLLLFLCHLYIKHMIPSNTHFMCDYISGVMSKGIKVYSVQCQERAQSQDFLKGCRTEKVGFLDLEVPESGSLKHNPLQNPLFCCKKCTLLAMGLTEKKKNKVWVLISIHNSFLSNLYLYIFYIIKYIISNHTVSIICCKVLWTITLNHGRVIVHHASSCMVA